MLFGDGFVCIDEKYWIIVWNFGVSVIFGYVLVEVIGCFFEILCVMLVDGSQVRMFLYDVVCRVFLVLGGVMVVEFDG